MSKKYKHVDEYIGDIFAPKVLRFYLLINRLPASEKALCEEFGVTPKLFADYKGKRVQIVMASVLGDVGITHNLEAEYGYETRVPVDELENFGDKP